MADEKYNFQDLAIEAAETTYDPRAKRCLPFLHTWSMWERSGRIQQERRCVSCGLHQIRTITRCWGRHVWETLATTSKVKGGKKIGKIYHQECENCCAMRRI